MLQSRCMASPQCRLLLVTVSLIVGAMAGCTPCDDLASAATDSCLLSYPQNPPYHHRQFSLVLCRRAARPLEEVCTASERGALPEPPASVPPEGIAAWAEAQASISCTQFAQQLEGSIRTVCDEARLTSIARDALTTEQRMAVCSTIQSQVRPVFLSECHKHYLAPDERRRPAGGSGELTLEHVLVLAWLFALGVAFVLHQRARSRLALFLLHAGVHVGSLWIHAPGYLERRYDLAPLPTQEAARRDFKMLRYSLWAIVALIALPFVIALAR
jgi:hypothetical protein